MTIDGAVAIAGLLLVVGGLGAPLCSRTFCTRPAPAWAREYRDVALALVGVRWATREPGVPADHWWVGAVFVNLAVAQLIVFGANLYSGLVQGDRCPSRGTP